MSVEDSLFASTIKAACEQTSIILPEAKAKNVGDNPDANVSPACDSTENNEYLARKALSASGIWGRIKEVPSGCWEWQGTIGVHGYGAVAIGGRVYGAHRIIFEIFNGPLLHGQATCHACNNPLCCNPRHLTIGSAEDNMHDAIEKLRGRRPRKVSVEDLQRMAKLREEGAFDCRSEAKRYGVTPSALYTRLLTYKKIVGGGSWKKCDRKSAAQIIPEATLQEAKRLKEECAMTIGAIAKQFGVPYLVLQHALFKKFGRIRKGGAA